MPIFRRRTDVPETPERKGAAAYRRYRPYVREDFRECCAYCLMHELLAGGADAFDLDHFKPKSDPRFSALAAEYSNLYYACHVCNRYKSRTWPPEALIAKGYRFVDTCTESFSEHFREDPDGSWTPVSKAGEYTVKRVRLNRQGLIAVRSLLKRIAAAARQTPVDWDLPTGEQFARLVDPSRGD